MLCCPSSPPDGWKVPNLRSKAFLRLLGWRLSSLVPPTFWGKWDAPSIPSPAIPACSPQYQLANHSTSLQPAVPTCIPQYQLAAHSTSMQPTVPACSPQHQHAARSTSLPLGAFLFSSVSGFNGGVKQGTWWKCHSQFLTYCILFPKELKLFHSG